LSVKDYRMAMKKPTQKAPSRKATDKKLSLSPPADNEPPTRPKRKLSKNEALKDETPQAQPPQRNDEAKVTTSGKRPQRGELEMPPDATTSTPPNEVPPLSPKSPGAVERPNEMKVLPAEMVPDQSGGPLGEADAAAVVFRRVDDLVPATTHLNEMQARPATQTSRPEEPAGSARPLDAGPRFGRPVASNVEPEISQEQGYFADLGDMLIQNPHLLPLFLFVLVLILVVLAS
jgi:hypothetical protein